MGSDKYSDKEKPQHIVDVPHDYWIAKFPVTNELYGVFAKFNRVNHSLNVWEDKKDHPVVNVGWNDAMGYCEWLSGLLKVELPFGFVLRLPTEAEWEKAASWIPSSSKKVRGEGEALEFPWGNTFEKNKCNTGENGTTPVGLYSPRGDSPYGCADMIGNVWEWTHSLFKPYPYRIDDGREDEKTSGHRVLRGGTFIFSDIGGARCSFRYISNVTNFPNYLGFRVCVAPPIPK